jgi:hypothetical protein
VTPLRKTRDQIRIEGGNPDLGWVENGYALVDPHLNKCVSRICAEVISASRVDVVSPHRTGTPT